MGLLAISKNDYLMRLEAIFKHSIVWFLTMLEEKHINWLSQVLFVTFGTRLNPGMRIVFSNFNGTISNI